MTPEVGQIVEEIRDVKSDFTLLHSVFFLFPLIPLSLSIHHRRLIKNVNLQSQERHLLNDENYMKFIATGDRNS